MSEHTPGPWHVRTANYPERAHPQVYAGNKRIAEPCNSVGVPAPESDANARLMATAPEFLAECESMVQDWESGVEFDHATMRRHINAMRAVIAKARGNDGK